MRGFLLLIKAFIFIWGITSCQNRKVHTSSKEILSHIDSNDVSVVRLPTPNSGSYSFEEAKNRKNEIYDMQLSIKHHQWKNPTTGGAIHINQHDEIEIYQFTLGLMYLGKGIDENGDSVVYVDTAPKDTSIVVKPREIKHHVGGIGFGNPASVLITSEFNLKESKSLGLILNEVFEPGTQIYYLKSK